MIGKELKDICKNVFAQISSINKSDLSNEF